MLEQRRTQEPIRIGIIGAGIMGTDHAQLLASQVRGAVVAGIADADPIRSEQLATSVGAKVFKDGESLIAAPEVDAVIIASADHTHHRYTMAALAARKPVLTEKPLAPTIEECREIVLADMEVDSSGSPPLTSREDKYPRPGLVSVGFMRRFDPSCAHLRNLVDEETYGRALLVHCVSRGVSAAAGSSTESAISNSAIHEIDFVPWLLGSPVTAVTWQAPAASKHADGLADPQLFTLETASGAIASCELFLNARYGHDVRSEVVFEEGVASTVEPTLATVNHAGASATTFGPDWRRRWAEAYRLELQTWVDALKGKALNANAVNGVVDPPASKTQSNAPDVTTRLRASGLASAADGMAAILVVEALIASHRSGGMRTPVRSVADVLQGSLS